MPDINNSLAMQVNANPINLQSTLGTISQIQLAQAHAGLYGLQAQQEARKLNALQFLKDNPTDYQGYIQQGGDPAVGAQLQQMGERSRQYATNPQGLSTESVQQLTGAARNQAEVGKLGVETKNIGTDVAAKLAQGVIADPGNTNVWQSAVNQHYQTVGGSALEKQQLLGIQDPNQRMQIAKAYAAQGVPPGSYGEPHNVPPTDTVTTRGAAYAVPQRPVSPGQGGMIPGERIIGGSTVSTNGVPMPNQQVANRFGTLPPAMSVGQAKESEAYGADMAKVLPALAEKANQSRQANFTLEQMRDESKTWDMGKGAQTLMTAAQYLKPIANGMGSDVFDKPVADYESFNKNAGTLVRQAVKEVSSRAAVQEFNLIQKQLPSSDMSRQGFNQIVNQFHAVNDFNIAKQQAGQEWRDTKGTMNGFETDWNKSVTPTAFFVATLPPDQLGALKANLSRTPEGRATLKSVVSQIQWAHDHNLDQVAQ